MQAQIRCGDTLDFTTTLTDYPASAGWTLTYRLIPRTSGTAITLSGIASGDDHRTLAAAATTAGWTAGEYSWSAFAELGAERYGFDSGIVTLLPDLESATAYDGRSQAEVALDDARAALATFHSSGGRIKAYTIAGRSMEFDGAGDILTLVSYWQAEVTCEQAARAVAKGLADPRRIYLRAGRA